MMLFNSMEKYSLQNELNPIIDQINQIWKITFEYINNPEDENLKRELAIQKQQQELEDKFLNFYQAKLLKITGFAQKERLVDTFISKIEELKISIQGTSQKYPDSKSTIYRELVCDSIKTKLLEKKEELKKEKLEAMNKKTELLLSDFFVNSPEKKDPLKTLLQSIIKPWKVEFFPNEFSQDKENMFVENFINDKKLQFLQDIKTLISSFDKNEISQTISLFQEFKNLLSSFYSQNSQGYKIRNDLISDILQILRERGKTVEIIPELEEKPENLLTPKEEFPSLEIEAENNLNYQLFLILSKKIIDLESYTTLAQQDKKDFISYLNSINIEDPDTKKELNKNFTLQNLYSLRFKCLTSEKLNSIIVNKIEDFLLTFNNDFSTQDKSETVHIKLHLEKPEIMDKFVEKLKTNSKLNYKTIFIAYSLENPNPLKNILSEAIEKKHFSHKTQPNQLITSVYSSPARLNASSIAFM
jgi:hypothetical protein